MRCHIEMTGSIASLSRDVIVYLRTNRLDIHVSILHHLPVHSENRLFKIALHIGLSSALAMNKPFAKKFAGESKISSQNVIFHVGILKRIVNTSHGDCHSVETAGFGFDEMD